MEYAIDIWAETAEAAAIEATKTARDTDGIASWTYVSVEDEDGHPLPHISGQVDVTTDFITEEIRADQPEEPHGS